jgi:hypothetical protein
MHFLEGYILNVEAIRAFPPMSCHFSYHVSHSTFVVCVCLQVHSSCGKPDSECFIAEKPSLQHM